MTVDYANKPLLKVQSVKELFLNVQAISQIGQVSASNSNIDPNRLMRMIAVSARKNTQLFECDPMSLLGAAMTCASMGIEPNTPAAHAYLIPFKNHKKNSTDIQLIVGYKGMLQIAYNSGAVSNLHADVVYEKDVFEFEYGSNQHLKHRPIGSRDNPKFVYCYGKVKNGGENFAVIPYSEVLKVRDSTQSYKTALKFNNKETPWIKWQHQMACKTAIRAFFNQYPMNSKEVDAAVSSDESCQGFSEYARDPSGAAPSFSDTIDGQVLKEIPQEDAQDYSNKDETTSVDPEIQVIANDIAECKTLDDLNGVSAFYETKINEIGDEAKKKELKDTIEDRKKEFSA